MRKQIINPLQQLNKTPAQNWLNVENIARVEISSEDAAFPVESALLLDATVGWRAASPGKQTLRLIFDNPQSLKLIRLGFLETDIERTQEFVLRWSSDGGSSYQEIVRQQWNFNPNNSTAENEDYQVELASVTVLELSINPDISGKNVLASLVQLRLA